MTAIQPVAIADDDNMLITATAQKVDVDGDPGYVLDITNRTDRKVYVYSAEGWTVGGKTVDDPVLLEEVGPGETAQGFMWFDHEETGLDTLADLVKVKGVIVVEDFDTAAKVAAYPVSL